MSSPFDNVPLETLEKILANSGQFMRQEMRDELMARIAYAHQHHPSKYFLRSAGDAAKASRYAEDWSQRASGTYDISQWCKEFGENTAAVNEVLQYLQAQMAMDLFNHNARATRVFQHIIKAGIQATIFNRDSVRDGDFL